MNIILFDDQTRKAFLPLAFTKPIGELRIGILKIAEKYQTYFPNATISFLTENYLQSKYQLSITENNFLINARVLPSPDFIKEIIKLTDGEKLLQNSTILAVKLSQQKLESFLKFDEKPNKISRLNFLTYADLIPKRANYQYTLLENVRDIFLKNETAFLHDFELLTKNRTSQQLSKTNTLIGNNIFIEEGAKIEAATINTETGPVYIGKNAEIMEGSVIRGPLALCDNAVLKLGTKIYGPTTIGPFCKVGGEVNNVVFQSYSNKGHDGFLGNSVIGEWCNLGADTNSSNLKNNYGEVKVWDYEKEALALSGLQFCGLIMGDHSKCGINTMFNTGTTVGVFANIFGGDFPPKFIPSFTWGGAKGFVEFKFEKALEVAEAVMKRRDKKLTKDDVDILKTIFETTKKYRNT